MQFLFNIQLFAHKKGQGSVKNGRDSNPKYLGVKKPLKTSRLRLQNLLMNHY